MKRLFFLLALAFLFTAPAFAAEPATASVCEQITLAEGASYTGAAIDVSRAEGWFIVSIKQTGFGPVDISYQLSVNGIDWAAPVGAEGILNDVGAGFSMAGFDPVYAPWLRIIVSNTGSAEVIATVRVAYR